MQYNFLCTVVGGCFASPDKLLALLLFFFSLLTKNTKYICTVFLHITVCVQYRVIVEYAYEAYYTLTNVKRQMETLVYSVIRSTIPDMTLDDVFESKSHISDAVFTGLQRVMKEYGYEIVTTLLTKLSPNELVKTSMNEMNACKRYKDAMPHRAEAGKCVYVIYNCVCCVVCVC